MPPAVRTVCLEFFGAVREAVPSIVEIRRYLDANPGGARLAGLEHLDERYVKAVGYATKARRPGRPKMVLVGDIVGEDENAVAAAASHVVRIANARHAEGFIAVSPDMRKKFWLDRARTAAISKHTNAFKINEDVVIPIDRLGDYSDGIEHINIELSIRNKLKLLDALETLLHGDLPLARREEVGSGAELLGDRVALAKTVVADARARWRWLLDNIDAPLPPLAQNAPPAYATVIAQALQTSPAGSLFHLLQDHTIRVSWKTELCAQLADIFDGRPFVRIVQAIEATHKQVLRGRVFVALHMHAGDGNVHTNIPVNSDDYEMLQEAAAAVARIMRLAVSLDGCISGEHGIGITKLEFLDADKIEAFRAYKERVDPNGHFNKGKLLPGADLRNAYTPSFSLIGAESLILEQSEIGRVAGMIKDCLRCGKCKAPCPTHSPRANLLYSPRNKILATSLLTEAFLYEEQTRRGISLKHFDEYGDVAGSLHRLPQVREAVPRRHRFRRRLGRDAQLPAAQPQAAAEPRPRGVDVLPERDRSDDDQRAAHRDDPHRLSRAAPRASRGQSARARAAADEASARNRRQAADARAGDPLHQQADARQSAQEKLARAARHRRSAHRADHPRSAESRRRRGCGVLFSGLRLGAALRPGRPRDAGHALRSRRADRAAAGLPVLRLSADRGGRRAQRPGDHHREPRALPSRRAHA